MRETIAKKSIKLTGKEEGEKERKKVPKEERKIGRTKEERKEEINK